MGSHRPPAPSHPSRLWLGLMAAAVTGIVGGTVAAAHAVAPRVAADVRLSLTPENSPEPVGHGGPLSVPSIGAVTSDPVAYLPPAPRPPQRPVAVPTPRLRVTGTPETTSQAVSGDLGAIASTSQPTVTPPSQTVAAATTTEATTASATTTADTTTTSPTEATETTTAATTSSTVDLPDEVGLP